MHDMEIQIAVGKSRYEKQWKNQTVKWSAFLDKLKDTYKTRETISEYLAMTKKQRMISRISAGLLVVNLKMDDDWIPMYCHARLSLWMWIMPQTISGMRSICFMAMPAACTVHINIKKVKLDIVWSYLYLGR